LHGSAGDGIVARWYLRLAGLACARCARRIEDALGHVPGIWAAIVNRATESLTVEFMPGKTDLEAVRAALYAQGFHPRAASASGTGGGVKGVTDGAPLLDGALVT
jgi:cation transport ATPase